MTESQKTPESDPDSTEAQISDSTEVATEFPPEWARQIEERILFSDSDLLVINKPAGLPSQASRDPTRYHAYGAAIAWAKRSGNDDAYVGMHQRLDRETSGVLFFTRSRAANKSAATQTSRHLLNKVYLAVVFGEPEADTWNVQDKLKLEHGKHPRMRKVESGGDSAESSFKVLKRANGIALIEARPRTGRMHQIRVHLAGSGHPILGDWLYAGANIKAGRAAKRTLLHAASLEMWHPISGKPMRFEAPVPPDFERAFEKAAART